MLSNYEVLYKNYRQELLSALYSLKIISAASHNIPHTISHFSLVVLGGRYSQLKKV